MYFFDTVAIPNLQMLSEPPFGKEQKQWGYNCIAEMELCSQKHLVRIDLRTACWDQKHSRNLELKVDIRTVSSMWFLMVNVTKAIAKVHV